MPKLRINSRLAPLFEAKQPIIVIYGGRDSGKSIGVGDFLLLKMATEGTDVLCLREFQDSVNDSVHKVFKSGIEKRLGLNGWEVMENRIVAPNGARTVYKGANRNPDSIQSAQDFLMCWFEEAHRASQSSLDKLLPTIIRNYGAKCIFTANPQSAGDPFSERFIVPYLKKLNQNGFYEDDLHLIIKINYRDNPWYYDSDAELLRDHDFKTMSRAKYDWIWEGAFNDEVDDSIIKPEWFDAAIDLHLQPQFKRAFEPTGAKKVAHDPSGEGNDAKGLAISHGSILLKVEAREFGDIDDGCDWATDEAIKANADWFIWDSDGMGYGLKRQVTTNLRGKRVEYHPFRGSLSGSAQDNAGKVYILDEDDVKSDRVTYKDHFKNNRSQHYSSLATRFFNSYRAREKGDYVDPADMISIASKGCSDIMTLRSELCRIPSKPNGQGLFQIMSKQEMLKKGIKSPNMADSIMMLEWQPPAKSRRDTSAVIGNVLPMNMSM
jgi:phage terminase large subunit